MPKTAEIRTIDTGVKALSIWMNDTLKLMGQCPCALCHSRQVGRVTEDQRARKEDTDREDGLDIDVPCHRDAIEAIHEVGRRSEDACSQSL